MGLALRPQLKLGTKLAPVMRLGLEMLALPINELKETVKKELESNPALEGKAPVILPRLTGITGDNGFLIDNAKAKGKTLAEHLLGELRMSGFTGRDYEIAAAVVCELDENGYFKGEVPSMMMTLEASAEEIEAARQRVMAIDPKGCGAKDLHECLLAQIGIVPKTERAAFIKGIADILNERIPPAKRISEAAKKYVLKMKAAPGKAFEYVKINYVTPDVAVDAAGEVTVDTQDIPVLGVSRKYVEMAKDRDLDEETRKYAAERVKRAREFRDALQKRQDTLEKVCGIAIAQQMDFLQAGPEKLKRLTMSEVAKAAKCSVSTVSRAADRKFVKTPRGIIPLRKFFVVNDQAPYEKLRALIAAQPNLSDQKIANLMDAAGFPMKRRTVAKWRKLWQKEEYGNKV